MDRAQGRGRLRFGGGKGTARRGGTLSVTAFAFGSLDLPFCPTDFGRIRILERVWLSNSCAASVSSVAFGALHTESSSV